ncbi:MAG: DUF1800 family protein [Pseudomonadales bacterium]|nr:DUF1800 family protein [Pseudomonadales bacterium]
MKAFYYVMCIGLLFACGGGGGGGGGGPQNPPVTTTPPAPPAGPTAAEMTAAARLLDLATFGATYDEIEDAAVQGADAWLEAQLVMPASQHMPVVQRYITEYGFDLSADPFPGFYRRFAFWEQALTAPDQLRQLVAYALTQIFVVSDNVGAIVNDPRALGSYYDLLMEHGFGNYRDLLRAVTLHPAMGLYLSHVNNGKSDPITNTFPDENYAREVMQLFSIGLFELNPDGTRVLDGGDPIPTYANSDIREFSKIFTGLSYGPEFPGGPSFFGKRNPVMHVPMTMFDDFHEEGDKQLLNGFVVPAGQSGMEDLDDAIDNLFNHPNVGPFIGKQLIQRLVTSNPSPEYVSRVSAVFADNGAGVRGDMRAVIRAILTDAEVAQGIRLREPFRRYVALNRSLHSVGEDGTYPGLGFVSEFLTGQNVLSAPSVFNFYLPIFSPAGSIKDAGLAAPEFQITDASTIIGMTNLVAYALFSEQSLDTPNNFTRIVPDLSEFESLASDGAAMVDRIDLIFFGGAMDDETRAIITQYVSDTFSSSGDTTLTAQVGLYLSLTSPAYAVNGGDL